MSEENKKSLIEIILIIGIIIVGIYALSILIPQAIKDYKEYNMYNDFCEERPNFCYCGLGSCEFNTRWDSTNGLSNKTKELCKLANELNDKKTLFKVGCNLE